MKTQMRWMGRRLRHLDALDTFALLLLLAVLIHPLFAHAQAGCVPDSATGGTKCGAPLKTLPQPGASTTSVQFVTPATTALPCPTGIADPNNWAVCYGKDANGKNAILVDSGDGKGYVSYAPIPGPQGPAGPAGVNGAAGPQGVQGVQGIAGTNGKDGINGKDGAAGAQGSQGVPGVNGSNGKDGVPGPAGQKGDKGDSGAVGSAGADGKNGVDGIPGAQGLKGDKGDTGPAGTNGTNGLAFPVIETCDGFTWSDQNGAHWKFICHK